MDLHILKELSVQPEWGDLAMPSSGISELGPSVFAEGRLRQPGKG